MQKRKYHFKDTMMDERLIGEYKDEIKLEIAEPLGIEMNPDAVLAIEPKELKKNKENKKESVD